MQEHFRIRQTQVGELERGYDRQGQKRQATLAAKAPRRRPKPTARARAEILHPGAASHTGRSSIVVFPGQDILFSGDILFTDFHPFLGEGDFPGWTKALDMIAGLKLSRIVPVHGPLSGAKDLADIKEYLATFDARARELSATVKNPKLMAKVCSRCSHRARTALSLSI